MAAAKVTVRSNSTGLTRVVASAANGAFTASVLPPGLYTVRVEQAGFATFEQTNVEVNVGSTRTLILPLKVGEVTESITVSDTSLVDTTKTVEADLVDRKQIQDLPINGRRVDQFALLSPGVARDGRFGTLSFRGASGNFNNYTIEGNDDNQAYFSEPRGRTRIASSVSANAVQEFQVGKAAYSAEFGRAAGGSINTVIRSGGNAFHADAFYYYRDQDMQARDPLASVKPAEKRQQFGGSVSGPVLKNKLFYFVNYDQQIRDFPLIIEDLNNVLGFSKPVLPSNPTPAQSSAFEQDNLAFTTGSAFLKSKFPNGAPGNIQSRTLGQQLSLVKSDYLINSSNTLSVFYNFLRSSGDRAIQSAIVLPNVGRNGTDDVRVHSLNLRLTSTIGANRVNEARFQFGRDFEFEFADQPPPQTTINVGSNPFSFGRATFLERPAYPDEYRYQFVNNFSVVTNGHAFKFGGEVNRVHDGIDNPSLFGGQFIYASALAIGRDLVDKTARNYTTYNQNFGVSGIPFSTIEYALFAQDQWRVTKKITLNYGVRYDYQKMPDVVVPNAAIPETLKLHSDPAAFGPRAGVAYDLRGNGKTVLRAGYAMYYSRIPNGLIQNALAQTGITDPAKAIIALSFQPTDLGAPTYPNILPSIPASARGSASVFRLDSDFKQSRVQDVSIGVERQLSNNLVLSASYVYTKGQRLQLSYDNNLPSPTFQRTYSLPDGKTFTVPFVAGVIRTAAGVTVSNNLARPNPAFGAITSTRSLAESWYNGMFLQLRRRFANGIQFSVGYTLAKAENLAGNNDGGGTSVEGAFGGGTVADQFNLGSNRASAPTDQRHRMVSSAVWEPRKGIMNHFRFSAIYSAEAGRPVAAVLSVPSIPFLAADGNTYNGFGGLRGQGTGGDRNLLPTIPRNSTAGDANYRLDLRIARDFPLRDKMRLELIGEAFNLANRANYNGYNTTIYNATATANTTPLATPIALTSNASYFQANNDGAAPDGTNARRLQVAIRFRF